MVVLLFAATGFALTPLALAWLWAKKFSPRKPGPDKNAIYECGLESKGDAWIHFRPQYYLYAIIFLIFDVETIFLLPFAVAFVLIWELLFPLAIFFQRIRWWILGIGVLFHIATLFLMNIFFPHQVAMYLIFVNWEPRIRRIVKSRSV